MNLSYRTMTDGLLCVCVCVLQSKMSLQLYQVDQKSYLLDFKSLSNVDIHESMSSSSSVESARMPHSPPSSCSDLGE